MKPESTRSRRNAWVQHYFGYLPSGDRLMICTVRNDLNYRRKFPVVLLCKPDGLYRAYRDGRERQFALGYVWPEGERKRDQEKSLAAHAPTMWGTQGMSGCIIGKLPQWLLRSGKTNLGRLLLAWFAVTQAIDRDRVERIESEILPGVALPVAQPLRPVALTILPNTDVVIRVLHSGVLLARLKRGLERIYISEYSWIRAPSIEASVRALATRFPQHLVLVKAKSDRLMERILGVSRPRASEYQTVGCQLQDRYEDDFGYDRLYNTAPLDGIFRLRVGDVPRGTKMLWTHQLHVEFDVWASLDIDRIHGLDDAAQEDRARHNARSSRLLGEHFEAVRKAKEEEQPASLSIR